MQINWESFATYNHDARGIRFKFEDLCRQLFANENLSGNKQFKYLHANPNNHGLETEPVYDETNKRWIGFQAKFFDQDVRYEQIKHSAEKTVEYYTGKEGIVELVFLFCNKPITSTAVGYINAVEILKKANIDVQLITDTAILDLIRNKYSYLGLYYFGNHSIQQEWFATHTSYMLDELGERYNREFNVETIFSDELSLFIHDQRAAKYLNAKKTDLLGEIKGLLYRSDKKDYLRKLEAVVLTLPDVDIETLYHSIEWNDVVRVAVAGFLDIFEEEIKKLEAERDKQYILSYDNKKERKEREDALSKYHNLGNQIRDIDILIELPDRIAISEREKQLLYGDILTVYGKAGIGKSQLLASKMQSLLGEKRIGLLLVAGIYFTDDPIHEQIMKNLRLNYNFEDLIDILETIGERDNCIVPVFIDALNETWNRKLWKSGLPSIMDKIKRSPMVKMILSYRSEYKKLILPDIFLEGRGDMVTMLHRGFEDNSISAAREFLNHYNIPFTPLEYFGYEMSNPLFLTLYCKTYNGEEVSLPTLYDRVIEHANGNISRILTVELRQKGYTEGDDILSSLIMEIAEWMVSHDERFISQKDLTRLDFWEEYGLNAVPFVRNLIKEHILYESIFEGVEKLYFAFDQMNDYYCAKAIMKKYQTKEETCKYLSEKILGIQNGKLGNLWNLDLFINASALYAEKYGEECIGIIDNLENADDKWQVFSRYIDSFQWRNTRYIPAGHMEDLLKKYPCGPEDLWPMLIGNSVKISHTFNADFLHHFLLRYKLNKRDWLWTVYINKLAEDEDNRIVQLIQMYDKGEKLEITDEKQMELLLTLFGWILSSSNRWLRDYASKAMIEILKEHFQLCQVILEKFKYVDDPYIIQRLYGIVFGACCKRLHGGNFQALAEYVYHTVFAQKKVYPDILLRDYARLIIERFLYENPEYIGIIDRKKIVPPYNSDPIPEIEDQHYLEKEYDGAMFWLIHSMRFEGMGMYGDFGRYVFQSALHSFDIDDKKIFNYAVYYIQTELGFSEEYFGEHDRHCGSYGRHQTIKTERIGKKYQWITMFNLLARISDHCKMVDRWNYPEKGDVQFEGAWEPYVRDFDPTLNQNFMICDAAPKFGVLDEFLVKGKEENKTTDISTADAQKIWIETKGIFFNELKDTLILTDHQGTEWVCLTKYCDTGRKDIDTEKLLVWSWLYAYFVSPEQAGELARCAENGWSVITHDTASHHETYSIFNREYPWSPSCRELNEYAWVDVQIKTGEYEIVTEMVQVPDLSPIEALLRQYGGLIEDDEWEEAEEDDFEVPEIPFKKETKKREIEKEIGKILHATTDLLWEEEYDATKENAISQSLPCAKLIEVMNLRQQQADGFYYDPNGMLAAFDTGLTQKINSVVVRKDILDNFLDKTGMKLVWLIDAEKEIHTEDYSITKWSDWEAVFVYGGDSITGEIRRSKG